MVQVNLKDTNQLKAVDLKRGYYMEEEIKHSLFRYLHYLNVTSQYAVRIKFDNNRNK